MSKEFRPWKIGEAQLLPPSVQDYVPQDHVSRLIVSLVKESLDLSAILGSYRSGLGQPPFDPRMMAALLLHGYASGIYSSASKHKAMSYDRMKKREAELEAEVDRWLKAAEAADAEEDKLYGKTKRGDELPDWVADKAKRLAKIREARCAP